MYDTKLLIDTIATSDEFWEFERNSELLSDKFQAYTSTLSAEEYNKLMENLNDDDYMEEFIGKANLEKELQHISITFCSCLYKCFSCKFTTFSILHE